MNLLRGEAADGLFRHPAAAADVAVAAAGPVILGQRPEELSLAAPGEGDLTGTVYSAELLGDSTLVTFGFGPDRVAVKAGKTCPARMGDRVGVALDRTRLHLFGPEGGSDSPRPGRPERGRNAMRFATAETPVLPPERASVFFDGIFSITAAAASGRCRGRSRGRGLVRQRGRPDPAIARDGSRIEEIA